MSRKLVALAVLMLAASACGNDVPRPTSDDSPPNVSMTVQGTPAAISDVGTDKTLTILPDEKPVVLASTDDPQGAKSIAIDGGYTVTCESSTGLGQVKQGTIRESQVDTSTSSTVSTKKLVSFKLEPSEFSKECAGSRFVGYHGQLRATGENYGGKTAQSGLLTFRFQRGVRALKVGTYNILGAGNASFGIGTFESRLDGFAAALNGFDIVLLQEVAQPDQAQRIASRIGMQFVAVGNKRDGTPGDTAIISKYPLSGIKSHNQQPTGCTLYCPKSEVVLVEATADVNGLRVAVFSTHWTPDSAEGFDRTNFRHDSSRFTDGILAAISGPVIFGGDLNDDPASGPVARIAARLTDSFTTISPEPSHCGSTAATRIDYVFVKAPLRATSYVGHCSDPPQTTVSLTDHPLVVVDMTVV